MVDAPVEVDTKEDVVNSGKPVCPVCIGYLTNAHSDYTLKKIHPDTRWFRCDGCEAHVGYHRMRRKWYVDPYDFDYSEKLRKNLNLESAS